MYDNKHGDVALGMKVLSFTRQCKDGISRNELSFVLERVETLERIVCERFPSLRLWMESGSEVEVESISSKNW
jgi:hypothetical protein